MKSNKLSILMVVVNIVFGLVIGICIYLYKQPMDTNMPARKMPQPNAFGYYVRASYKILYAEQCSEAIHSGSYAKSLSSNGRILPAPPKGIPRPYTLKRPYTINEKRALLKANEPVFKILNEGLKHECLVGRCQFVPAIENTNICRLEPLLVMKTMVYNESGKYYQAMNTCLDEIKLCSDMSKGVDMQGIIASMQVFTNTGIDIPKLVNHLDYWQARSAAARLENIQSGTVSFRDILREEKYTRLSRFSSGNMRFGLLPGRIRVKRSTMQIFIDNNKALIGRNWDSIRQKWELRRLRVDMDKVILHSSRPYAEYMKNPIPNSGLFMHISKDDFPMSRYWYEFNRCANDRLLFSLLLRAYMLEHGKYPAKLDDLVPGYLKKIPQDPFTAKGEYKYKSTGDSYILYSIGPDGRDNGGKLVLRASKRPNMKAKGDFVIRN